MSYRKRQRTSTERAALEQLRALILSGQHAGRLKPGDRLPSYREIAERTGLDLRAVARLYASLAGEGLTETRGRLGVFLPAQESADDDDDALRRWTSGVLLQAWLTGIPVPRIPEFLKSRFATTEIRCACIESTQDQLVRLCSELARDFGLVTTPVHTDLLSPARGTSLPPALRDADMLVTTAFHAAVVRPVAEVLNKPLVLVRLAAEFIALIDRRLQERALTLVCVDARFIDRFRAVFSAETPDRVCGVLTHDARALARLHPREPVVITGAARLQIGERTMPPSVVPTGLRIVSPQTAAELIELIVNINSLAQTTDLNLLAPLLNTTRT
jgi:DNA-binding transcriptional regulator YhcF (GntR family)